MRVLISAGEASSDAHAAGFAAALLAARPGIELFGMGGSACRRAGVSTLVDSETAASVMGLSELGTGVFRLLGAYRTLVAECRSSKPDLAVLVDFPDFNFFIARALHRQSLR